MSALAIADNGAILDPTGKYRYRLWRRWGDEPSVTFIMLNPSTADASIDDPTIRRCIRFARDWRHGGLEVVNLCAFRATEPNALFGPPDVVGPENDRHIIDAVCASSRIIAAWGTHRAGVARGRAVRNMLACHWSLWHIGLTKDGHPRHPLYVRADTAPVVWE